MTDTSGMTLADVLFGLGYGHVGGRTIGKRSVVRGGVEVLHATAHETWQWLRSTGQIGARP